MLSRPNPAWCVPDAEGFWILRGGAVVHHDALPQDFSGILLHPFRTLSVQPFSYPFGNVLRIREALNLQYRSLLLGGSGVEILPTVLRREGKGASGVAWFWSRQELAYLESVACRRLQIWPLPLALGAAVGPNGVALWDDGTALSSLAWRRGIPFLARWRARGEGLDEEQAWFRRIGGEDLSFATLVQNPKNPQDALRELAVSADATWKNFPALHEVDLSSRGVEALVAWDQAFLSLRLPLVVTLLAGLFYGGIEWATLWSAASYQEALQARAGATYGELFGGNPTDPLSQARARLAEARGEHRTSRGASLEDVIRFVGGVWGGVSLDVRLENLRYSAAGAQLVGVAPGVGSLAGLKEALRKGSLTARLGDVQQIPDGRVRFTVEVGWQKP